MPRTRPGTASGRFTTRAGDAAADTRRAPPLHQPGAEQGQQHADDGRDAERQGRPRPGQLGLAGPVDECDADAGYAQLRGGEPVVQALKQCIRRRRGRCPAESLVTLTLITGELVKVSTVTWPSGRVPRSPCATDSVCGELSRVEYRGVNELTCARNAVSVPSEASCSVIVDWYRDFCTTT